MHIFADAHAILEGLAQRDCSAALAWCAQHRTRLRKLRSKLEFVLHTQVCLRGLPPAHRPSFPALLRSRLSSLDPAPVGCSSNNPSCVLPLTLALLVISIFCIDSAPVGCSSPSCMRDAEEQDQWPAPHSRSTEVSHATAIRRAVPLADCHALAPCSGEPHHSNLRAAPLPSVTPGAVLRAGVCGAGAAGAHAGGDRVLAAPSVALGRPLPGRPAARPGCPCLPGRHAPGWLPGWIPFPFHCY